ncbi:hypothetical protein SAMN03159423_5372 [Bradyrhizobium sp. NFR13]|uniref:hypothetical protein n=1 Tax=Bradyrhizobium sp. NFR13 TaxID=1566285 RepID=UPI0008F32F31|nr:hypothetical protein [Bradyrhizobium sp. NFR13]SFM10222.1 hypothetical protein SAMN03159423_5372 [Bradyrhizobium sp. NFR13]
MDPAASFIDVLKRSADQSSVAEDEFRRGIAERMKELEKQRSFAFRRLHLMKEVAGVITQAESEEIAIAGATVVLRAKLGWMNDSEARSEVLSRFAPVAQAMFASLVPSADDNEEKPDVIETLGEFEAWYAATHPNPFWILFENYMPETPVVDF